MPRHPLSRAIVLAATARLASRRFFVGLALVASALAVTLDAQEQPVTPPSLSPEQQQRLAAMPPDVRMYEEYRYWAGFQPAAVQKESLKHYDDYLAGSGVSAEERAKRLATIKEAGRRLEVERWNRILTSDKPTFNTQPNAFLVDVTKALSKGRALDVGMGQGRNALFLAEQGWQVTGFDPADQAVAAAVAEAKRRNVKITTQIAGSENFEWGQGQWELIVLSYVTLRPHVKQIIAALAPGGVVVVEAAHRDATKTRSIGGGVVYDTNELLSIFRDLRVLRYEDVDAEADFGVGQTSRVVRLAAQKSP
jgi:SAM-dependent methyltransferase